MALTLESVDEILKCDSVQVKALVHSCGAVCFQLKYFSKMEFVPVFILLTPWSEVPKYYISGIPGSSILVRKRLRTKLLQHKNI